MDLFEYIHSSNVSKQEWNSANVVRITRSGLSRTSLILIGVFAVLLLAVFISSRKPSNRFLEPGVVPVPVEPSWVPYLGHPLNLVWNANSFLSRLREKYSGGIFSLNLLGTRHHILHTPGLTHTFFSQDEKADVQQVSEHIGVVVFGFPKEEGYKFQQSSAQLHALGRYLVNEEYLNVMVERTTSRAKEFLASFVTGNEPKEQQKPWERQSRVCKVINNQGKTVVEASLFTLVRDFIANMSCPSIMGSDFLENFPDFYDDIWTVDREFFKLIAALPWWIPFPGMKEGRTARDRVVDRLVEFEKAMELRRNGQDPGPRWSHLEDVGQYVKERMNVYENFGWSLRARAAYEHSLNWAANANSNGLTFWMLNRIYMDDELMTRLRAEISPYIRLSPQHNPSEQGYPGEQGSSASSSDFEYFDYEGLIERCALLKSCYIECLRLHTASWSFKMVKEDFALQARKDSQGWLLRKGDYCHAAHELHNTDPNYFPDPMVFKPDRHIKYDAEKGYEVADLGTIRPYGGGSSMCKERHFAVKEVMIFTAAIITMWDMEKAGGGEWTMPAPRKTTATHGTDDECRVWISRRQVIQ